MKYSIEYAHIYVDEIFNDSYIRIADEVKEITEKISSEKGSYNLCVMIDDYNPIIHRLKIDEFLQALGKEGVEPDFVIFESELIKMKGELLGLLKEGKIKRYYKKYIDTKNHFPCSFLIAVWYLMRLGILDQDKVEFYRYNDKKSFVADRLINVLQTKYTEVEETAHQIIKNSTAAERLRDIEYRYVD